MSTPGAAITTATPGPWRRYTGAAPRLHGLARVNFATPTQNAGGQNALNDFHGRDDGIHLEPRLAGVAADLQQKPPSIYTGQMRELAQDWYSGGPDGSLSFPYSATFRLSHGLTFTSDGKPWLIEIATAGAVPGVYALPLDVLNEASPNAGAPNDKGLFRLRPKTTALPAKTDPNWQQLSDASTFAALQGAGTPWASEGWAFNDQGSAAVVVCVGVRNEYFYTRLFRVDLTFDQITVTPPAPALAYQRPAPVGVAVSETEGDYLWQPRRGDRTRLKVPVGLLIQSRDNLHAGKTIAPAEQCRAPIYAFYKGDTLQVVRWHYDRGSSRTRNEPEPALTEQGDFGTWQESTSTQCYSSPGQPEEANSAKSGDFTTRARPVTVNGMIEYSGNHAADSASAIVDSVKTGADESTSVWDTVIIPIRDRAACYHFRETVTVKRHTGASKALKGWFVPPGPVYVSKNGLPAGVSGNMDWAFYKQNYTARGWETPWPEPFREYFKLDNMQDGASVRTAAQVVGSVTVYDQDLGEPRWKFFRWSDPATGQTAEATARAYAASRTNWEFVRIDLRGRDQGGVSASYGSEGSGFEQYMIVLEFVTGNVNSTAGVIQRAGLKAFNPTPTVPVVDTGAEPSADDTTTEGSAQLIGVRDDVEIAVQDSEIEHWARKAQGDFAQVWLVAQDSAANTRALYSQRPVPDGGNLSQTLTGSAHYTPDQISTEYLSWVGLP